MPVQQRYMNKSKRETILEFNVLEENKRMDKIDIEQKNVHNQNRQVRWNGVLTRKIIKSFEDAEDLRKVTIPAMKCCRTT